MATAAAGPQEWCPRLPAPLAVGRGRQAAPIYSFSAVRCRVLPPRRGLVAIESDSAARRRCGASAGRRARQMESGDRAAMAARQRAGAHPRQAAFSTEICAAGGEDVSPHPRSGAPNHEGRHARSLLTHEARPWWQPRGRACTGPPMNRRPPRRLPDGISGGTRSVAEAPLCVCL